LQAPRRHPHGQGAACVVEIRLTGSAGADEFTFDPVNFTRQLEQDVALFKKAQA
jgi:hypothetical protein